MSGFSRLSVRCAPLLVALAATGCAHPHPAPRPLEVERVGGLAGFGGPGSRLRSHGQIDLSTLSSSDQQAIESLFSRPPADPPHPDEFRYRLTRRTDQGPQTIEVPETRVPDPVRSAVKDDVR